MRVRDFEKPLQRRLSFRGARRGYHAEPDAPPPDAQRVGGVAHGGDHGVWWTGLAPFGGGREFAVLLVENEEESFVGGEACGVRGPVLRLGA